MEYEKLRKKAEKKVKAKRGFITTATVFGSISFFLFVLSIKLGGEVGFWLRLPILIFGLILIVMYVSIFGWPGTDYFDIEEYEAQVHKEMARIAGPKYGNLNSEKSRLWSGYREEDFV